MEPLQNRDHPMDTSTRIRRSIRALLMDNSTLTLHGLRTVLSKSSHIDIVGVARTRAEAFAAIQTYRPDVVILEVRVGKESGIDLCRAIRESHPNIGVLFFTAHDDKDLLHSAILAGAQGYILKSTPAETVARSIELVATGQAIMDQQLTQQVITWVRDGVWAAQKTAENICSKAELQLLSFVASGKTNKEIAQELNVVPSVVAARLQKIFKRLKITRRSEAARYYVCLEKDKGGQGTFSH